jgi:hypothetical protein
MVGEVDTTHFLRFLKMFNNLGRNLTSALLIRNMQMRAMMKRTTCFKLMPFDKSQSDRAWNQLFVDLVLGTSTIYFY